MRLLAVAAVVAASSIAATTWLVMSSTTAAIRQQQGQSLNADARIYDVLVGFAATHHSWAGVKATTERLSHSTGRPMLLTTLAHRPIVRTGHWRPLALQASATIDALHVDPVLDPRATGDGIDPRTRGPFGGHAGVTARRRALAGLIHGTAACLSARHLNDTVTFGLTAAGQPTLARAASDPAARTCFAVARRRQLSRYVAPAAMLFVGGTVGPTARVHLSGAHRLRIILVASAILLLTVVACGLAARRLTGPLRRLTAAAQRLSGGERAIRVPEAGSDELGRLITAVNAMAARRDELEQARSDMVSDVAHELRTPVSNIRGWLEAAHDGIAEPDQALLASLLEEAIVLHRIIDDLRDLSAADAGELVLHCEPVELAGLLEQTAAAHRDAAQAAEVSIVLDVEQGLGCEVDPVRVRQAIGNLVANAIQHSPSATTVTLRGRRASAGVRLEVIDEGEGIEQRDLPHLFDRFYRAERSRSRRTGGRGLGLAITRRMVEAHGGTITVASVAGTGSHFTVTLPTATRSGQAHVPGPSHRSDATRGARA